MKRLLAAVISLAMGFPLHAKAEGDAPQQYLVTKNENGILTFDVCYWANGEPVNCRHVQTIGPDEISENQKFADRRYRGCFAPSVKSGVAIMAFGAIAGAVGGAAVLFEDAMASTREVRFAAILLAIPVLGLSYALATDNCRTFWSLVQNRLYETTISKVPDGYMRANRLNESDLSLINQLVR